MVIPESPTSGGWFLPAGDFNGDGFTDFFAGTTTSLEYIAFVNDARPQATIPNSLQAVIGKANWRLSTPLL